jgi:hypothetical protein
VRSRVAAVELTLSEAELSSGREGIAVLHTLKRYPAENDGVPVGRAGYGFRTCSGHGGEAAE